MFIRMLQFLAQAIPFILLCLAARKANLNKIDRGRQVLMPFIALLYCTIVAVILTQFHSLLIEIMGWISGFLPFLSNAGISHYMNLFNLLIVVIFLVLKGIFLPILNKTWKSKNLMQLTSGNFYEYEEDLDKWLLKKEYEQVKTYCNGIYYAALGASVLIFVLGQMYPKMAFAQTPCYPVFGVLVLGEVINYLSGISRTEFIEDVLGEDEESFKVANYGLLKDILKDLFGERVLYDATVDSGLDVSSSFETLEEMKKSENQAIRNLAGYFTKLKESGQDVEPNYVKSCVNLICGQSTLFCNPFYRDLTHYLMFPIMGQLMRYKKCLVIMGRDSATEDVKEWLEQGIFENVNTGSLWKVGVLENENPEIDEPDIGILKFSDLYNLRLQRNHSDFLSRVGFVFIVEPSRLLASGQAGVSLLVHRFDESKEPVVYAACDRNCDGLVDALSHVLKTTITEVTATLKSAATTSIMCWNAEGDYMHHRIFSNVSRYLGMGTEINAVALKYQIANTKWISSEKFPVMDMKWIAGQYYKKICNYTDLPVSQESFNRALRHIRINDWKDDENIGGQKSVEGISIYKGYCEIDIETAGYLEMTSYENLNAAKEVRVSGIPVRSYRNKLVMKLNLPDVSERVRYTLCLLLNEIFRTIYPDAYPYICAVTLVDTNHAPEKLKGAMYTLSGKVDGSAIYIVEDSEIDLGLIASVERNLKRYFEIITEVLMWHEQKMAENPKKESKPEDYETPFTPEAGKEEEAAKKAREKAEKENKRFLGKIKRKLRKFWEKITAGFKKKPKDEPVEETPTEETPTEETPIEETPEEGISEDSPTEETTSTDERDTETGTENVMKNVMYSAEAEMDIEGEDEQLVEQKMTKKTEYQKSCFLKYGYEEIDPYFDFGGTIKYLTKYGYDRNPLQQVRDGVKAAEADNAKYDPHKEGSHFCDFCGVELAGGEYELLKDGRERCNHCSSTALRTGEEFKEVYKMVVRNMEIFFGIKLNVAIKVRMTDAKTIAKHFGDEFVATPGFDGRVLGFAQKDSSGYSLYIENGSPKLAAMATIAHELTHIWQYQNWDEKMILSKYGKQYRLEIYEGMAKWAEIQYLLYLNEISYAKRQEIVTRLRDDEYGRGFIQYAKKYPLAYRHEKNATPFGRIPPL